MEATSNSFDSYLERNVGVLGKWQLLIFLVVVIASQPPLLSHPQLAFLTPPHYCAQPALEKLNWTSEAIKNATIPYHDKTFGSCEQYNVSIESISEGRNRFFNSPPENASIIPCSHGWTFEKGSQTFNNSFTEEFQLVCQYRYVLPFLSMAFFLGTSVGYPVGGYLGDRFGRANTWAAFCLISFVMSCGTALSVSPWMFFFMRCLVGAFISMAGVSGYVLCMEMTNAFHRNTFNFFFHQLYDSFNASVVLIAYFSQSWRFYHIGASVFCALGIFRLCLVSESPRWLVHRGRTSEAQRILRTAARCNGRQEIKNLHIANSSSENKDNQDLPNTSVWYVIFTDSKLRRTTVPMAVVWFFITLNYFGLSFFSVRLKGNPYVIASMTGLMGLPAGVLKLILYYKFDRRRPLMALLLIAGLVCCAGMVVRILVDQSHVIHVVLATIAIFFTAVSFMMIYTLTPELYPTSNRNFATGFLTGVSRFGAAASMIVERFDQWLWPALPMTIFCSTFILSGFMVCLVPQVTMDTEIIESQNDNDEEVEGLTVDL